jgi:hypothetical protein
MNPSIENTRELGVGDRIDAATSFIAQETEDGTDLVPVGHEYEGHIVEGDEFYTFRRLIVESPIDALSRELGLQTDIAKKALEVAAECIKLLDEKQLAYGMENVRWLGEQGLNYRVGEKVLRIKHLLLTKYDPATESLEDSWKDIINLSVIAIMVRRNLWK